MSEKEEIVISASKLDTFEGCSWKYWARYHLKAPSKSNIGSSKGNVCHYTFEALMIDRHCKYIDEIKNNNTCKQSPALWRYIKRLCKQEGLFTDEHYNHCDEMIKNAVVEGDFIPDPAKYIITPEEEFKIHLGDNVYIRGFIDLKITDKKTGEVMIRDYKSSKEKFAPKKIKNNLQGMMYVLSEYKKTGNIPLVCFWFLQYPQQIRQMMPKVTEAELKGFEQYLKMQGVQLRQMSEKQAKLGFAKNKPRPKKDEGFTGPLQCGFACHKGQLKKDGSPMWHCDSKFDFTFFAVRNEDGEIVKSGFSKKDLIEFEKKGMVIETVQYNGCPAFY